MILYPVFIYHRMKRLPAHRVAPEGGPARQELHEWVFSQAKNRGAFTS